MPNEQSGAIQVLDNSIASINQALAQVLERVDDLKGLRGPITVHDRLAVKPPIGPLDAVNLGEMRDVFLEQMGRPERWLPSSGSNTPDFAGDEQSDPNDPFQWMAPEQTILEPEVTFDPQEPLLWLAPEQTIHDPELLLDPHDPLLWYTGGALPLEEGQQPQNAPPNLATTSAIGSVLERYAAEDHTHGVTTGSFTITATGFDSSVTGTALYALAGPLVVLFIPAISGTSNATTFTLTGLPAAITPTRASTHVLRITDNGVSAFGYALLSLGSTTIALSRDALNSAWTASGTKQLFSCMLAYALV